jgi:hypothetical protein
MAAVTIDHHPGLQRASRDQVWAEVGDRAPLARRPSPARHRSSVAARRYQVVGAFAGILAACAVWAQAGAAGRAGNGPLAVPGAGPSQAVAARAWIVQPGDTIWAIARRVQPSGDIRPLVDRLSAEVHGRPLQVGEELPLP